VSPRLGVAIVSPPDPWHGAHLLAGLDALAAAGRIELSIEVPPLWTRTLRPNVGLIRIKSPSGDSALVSVDHQDQPNAFSLDALARSALYFKRSYREAEVARLSAALRSRVRPHGLVFPCAAANPRQYRRRLAASALRRVLQGALMVPLSLLRSSRPTPLSRFERPPGETGVAPTVSFCTRLWAPGETTDPAREQLNEERIAVARALRREFGGRFIGGVVPSGLARRSCPDLVWSALDQTTYLRTTHRSLVAVSTGGLHGSTPWKVAEALAAGQCLVSHRIRDTLPGAFTAGVDYATFDAPDECVERCTRLLQDSQRSAALTERSFSYYVEHVRPAAAVARCLDVTTGALEAIPLNASPGRRPPWESPCSMRSSRA
jgi:hypothetical protein